MCRSETTGGRRLVFQIERNGILQVDLRYGEEDDIAGFL